jgi:phosphatidylglycerol:prolipoprotein diacylglycerol transferase
MSETASNIGNVYFPHLNLHFNINSVAFNIFGIDIYWYGIIITMGMILGLLLASYIAKKENMNPEIITDFLMYDIVPAVIGARIYYVIFQWDQYNNDLLSILNIRGGGLAIYGAVITSIIVAVVYTRIKKLSFWKFADVASYGLLVGQIIGRYGNFFNREAFGDYTNNLFAMRLLKSEAISKGYLTKTILENITTVNGLEYIQVHPTFLYESSWNLLVLIFLLIYRRHRKGYGEIISLYILFYGIGRYIIEGLRTDQLVIMGTGIAISQVVAIASIALGAIGFLLCRKNTRIN